jgi:Zn-dependent protease
MDVDQPTPPYTAPNPPQPGGTQKNFKKALGPLAVLGALLAKFKVAIFATLKFLPVILKTGGTMFLSIWVYALNWGWWFALGFVLLIFVHECGHLLVAKRLGLRVGAPVFIPFMGALIALKDAPRNAWIEAQVGIGGPLLGTAGAAVCYGIYRATGMPLFSALAYTGFLINLFNLAPIGFLDGGRIVTALSPWLWLVGTVVIGLLMFVQFNFLLLLIFIFSLPRLFSLFRKKSAEEARYYEVTPDQRWIMGGMYFGLIALLVLGMMEAHVQVGQ